jgi:hypothetical protein
MNVPVMNVPTKSVLAKNVPAKFVPTNNFYLLNLLLLLTKCTVQDNFHLLVTKHKPLNDRFQTHTIQQIKRANFMDIAVPESCDRRISE